LEVYLMVGLEQTSLRLFRNPGGELRGIIHVISGPTPIVRVESFPTIQVEFDDIDDVFVAACDCFGIVGTGKSSLKAVEALESTLRIYLSEILRHGDLLEELTARGWTEVSDGARLETQRQLLRELRDVSRADLEQYSPQIALTGDRHGAVGIA
jgi:hypothetical protein